MVAGVSASLGEGHVRAGVRGGAFEGVGAKAWLPASLRAWAKGM